MTEEAPPGVTGAARFVESLQAGLRVVDFRLNVAGEMVPGSAWMPADATEPMPLVLIQHPLTGSRLDYFVEDVGRAWAMRGWICAGIDAPLHGDREVHAPLELLKDVERYPGIAWQFAGEVSAAVDALANRFPVDMDRVGYVGYSLGAMLGIPAVALDGRFRAAVFCLAGESGLAGPATGPGSHVPGLAGVAVRLVARTADEIVPRAATQALYDALKGDRDIAWLPGSHFDIGDDVIGAASAWLLRCLEGRGEPFRRGR